MCFITIELWRQCDRTVTSNCDAVTHNYEKKTVVTIQKSSLCFNPSQFFFIFGSSSSFYLVSLPPVDEQWTISVVLRYLLNLPTHPYHTKSSLCQSHFLTVHTSSHFSKNFLQNHFFLNIFSQNNFQKFFWVK